METTFYGHACLRVDVNGGSCLMDPWFSQGGAFFHSWFQFPENSHLLPEAAPDLTDICVSHHHADHFDPAALEYLISGSPTIRLHIARFATSWFESRVKHSLARFVDRIDVHDAWEPFKMGDAEVFFVPEECPGLIDTAIICRTDQGNVVNLNDSVLTARQLERLWSDLGRVDLLTLQGSGASEYPVCYTFGSKAARQRRLEKRRMKLAHCERIIDQLAPERILFFAGPPVFLDPALRHLNRRDPTSVFPDQLDIAEHFAGKREDIAERILFLLPGERATEEARFTMTTRTDPRLLPFTEKEVYLDRYASRRASCWTFDKGVLPDSLLMEKHLKELVELARAVSCEIGGEVEWIVDGVDGTQHFTVDFARGRVRDGSAQNPLYIFTVPAACVHELLSGRVGWDDLFLSLRMLFEERTDRYVASLKTLMKYPDVDVLTAITGYEMELSGLSTQADMWEVTIGERQWRIQRRCPHAGTDLAQHGVINEEAETITCALHRFCFDLSTGECRNTSGYRLEAKRLR